MKIVHELRGKDPQVSVGGCAYDAFGDGQKPPEWKGMRVDVLIVDCEQANDTHPFFEGDTIRIEGTLDNIRKACREILAQLDTLEEIEKTCLKAVAARAKVCEYCSRWIDPQTPHHGDGHGNRCPPGTRADFDTPVERCPVSTCMVDYLQRIIDAGTWTSHGFTEKTVRFALRDEKQLCQRIHPGEVSEAEKK